MNTEGKPGRRPLVRTLVIAGLSVAALIIVVANPTRDRSPDSDVVIDTIGTPELHVDSDFVDFGDVPYSRMVEASFAVTNLGDATLLFAEKPFIEVKDGC